MYIHTQDHFCDQNNKLLFFSYQIEVEATHESVCFASHAVCGIQPHRPRLQGTTTPVLRTDGGTRGTATAVTRPGHQVSKQPTTNTSLGIVV
jgi:hypothetical protein